MRASIDIGSNSLLLLVVDDAGTVVHDEQRVVGLGKGLGDRGVFRADRAIAGGFGSSIHVCWITVLGKLLFSSRVVKVVPRLLFFPPGFFATIVPIH